MRILVAMVVFLILIVLGLASALAYVLVDRKNFESNCSNTTAPKLCKNEREFFSTDNIQYQVVPQHEARQELDKKVLYHIPLARP